MEDGLFFDTIGMVGVAFYVSSYAALQCGLIRGNGYIYTIMNLIAASLVLVSLTNNFNLSSAVIQATWIAISVVGLTRYFILHHSIKLNAEETAFAHSKLQSISKPLVRRFFRAGSWVDLRPGTTIATEGQELGTLVYFSLGEADVSHAGQSVGKVRSDTFVGELTCFDGGIASATVTVTSPARVFQISSKALLRICKNNPELRGAIEQAIRKDTSLKLVEANTRMSASSTISAI